MPAAGDEAFGEQARALGDRTRLRLFRRIAAAAGPVTVAELTETAGLHHTAVRQHLARLVAAGLVREDVEHRSTRGRPRLRYAVDPAAAARWGNSGPSEHLSVLLAEALRTGDTPVEVGRRAGRARARPAAGETGVEAMTADMARLGFEPSARRTRTGVEIVLHHCPFAAAAAVNPEAVCGLHLGLAEGIAESIADLVVDTLVPRDPRRAGCRLVLRSRPAGSPP